MEGPARSATTVVDEDEMARVHEVFASRRPYRIQYYFEDGIVISDNTFGVVFVPAEEVRDERLDSGVKEVGSDS